MQEILLGSRFIKEDKEERGGEGRRGERGEGRNKRILTLQDINILHVGKL